MSLSDVTDRAAVLAAIQEATELGEDAFLTKYGFGRSTRYRIEHDGATYPSKAVLAAAHGVQFPEKGPLASSDFSGGEQTVSKASALDFKIVDLSDRSDGLGVALDTFMNAFPRSRDSTFSGDHPAFKALRSAAASIRELLPASLQSAAVRDSVGRGNWAAVPWIAVLDPAATRTTQEGVYPVLLFAEDMSSVEVTIAQGVTQLKSELGQRAADDELRRRAGVLSPWLEPLVDRGFQLGNDFYLGSSRAARDYVASTAIHKTFPRSELVDSDISQDVAELLALYGVLLEAGELGRHDAHVQDAGTMALIIYVGQSAVPNFEAEGRNGWWGWREQLAESGRVSVGDLIAFGRGFDGGSPRVAASSWRDRSVGNVVVGRITSEPYRTDERVMPDERAGKASYPWKVRFEIVGEEHDVSLNADGPLGADASEALRKSAINRGIGIAVPVAGSPLLERFGANESPPTSTPEQLRAASDAFLSAVQSSGLQLSAADVSAFFGAVAAKPFAIMTGQSGSGKTQLAMRLGEWLGSDSLGRPRMLVVPVRPDWTGPEYLFGYADALRSTSGKEVWAVPDALEFMLRATREPDAPYLLLLDEMNLAHVERYFADFLSGVESRQPVLPELNFHDEQWVAVGNSQRLPIPRNLLVVGTVNVDETTYMFSPKVLDRAFTFEFRTVSQDLDAGRRRPTAIGAADTADQRTLLGVVVDDNWHLENPAYAANEVAANLVKVHELLAGSGQEFGHRVMFESMRFAATLSATGNVDMDVLFDRILLTKVLPKLHGTRSRMERLLEDLLGYARGDDGAEPSLPLSHAKLSSMLRVLRDAQFVSFTE